ncbi:MAG: hypothetical protein JF625_17715 [Inquilinus limosus]|uniref:Uncharacterized protein n=1 Tax=Inquilinus limosus TaxID=171674 RepID=A0A952KLT3_9PROT|nr:hypothetical protein [Inquilinus limosus]
MPFPGHVIFPIHNERYSTPSGPGACSALCVRWILAIHRNPIAATTTSAFYPGIMGTKQEIERVQQQYETVNLGPDDEANILIPNGLRVTDKGMFGLEAAPIETFLRDCFANPGSYYVSLELDDNRSVTSNASEEGTLQHNIALYTGVNGYIIFDPNGGAYRSGGQQQFVSSARYWFDEYALSYQKVGWFRCELAR